MFQNNLTRKGLGFKVPKQSHAIDVRLSSLIYHAICILGYSLSLSLFPYDVICVLQYLRAHTRALSLPPLPPSIHPYTMHFVLLAC